MSECFATCNSNDESTLLWYHHKTMSPNTRANTKHTMTYTGSTIVRELHYICRCYYTHMVHVHDCVYRCVFSTKQIHWQNQVTYMNNIRAVTFPCLIQYCNHSLQSPIRAYAAYLTSLDRAHVTRLPSCVRVHTCTCITVVSFAAQLRMKWSRINQRRILGFVWNDKRFNVQDWRDYLVIFDGGQTSLKGWILSMAPTSRVQV